MELELIFSGFVSALQPQNLLFIMIGAFVLMAALKPSGFLSVSNFKSMAYQIPNDSIAKLIRVIVDGF